MGKWIDKITAKAAERHVPTIKLPISPYQSPESPYFVCTSKEFALTGIEDLHDAVDVFVDYGLEPIDNGNAFIADRHGFVVLGYDCGVLGRPKWFGVRIAFDALSDSEYVHPLLIETIKMELFNGED